MTFKRNGEYIRRLGDCAESVATVALARAAETYNPDCGATFTTYATCSILRSVLAESNRTFGPDGRKWCLTEGMVDERGIIGNTLPPDDALVEVEEEHERAEYVERVRELLGGIPDSHATLIAAARRLGLSACGSTTTLAQRVAERLREVLDR